MIHNTRSRKRRKKEKDVTWTRTEIQELIATTGSQQQPSIKERSRNSTKAKFLHRFMTKFNDVPMLTIEQWLDEMGQHQNRQKDEFTKLYIPVDEKGAYCSTIDGDINENDIIKSLRGAILGLQKLLVQTSVYLSHKQQMNKYKIFRNRYFSAMEGNQCKKYRKSWEAITEHFSSSKYYQYGKPFMRDINRLFQIIAQSKPLLSEDECVEAKQLLTTMDAKWMDLKKQIDTDINMPPKYHYFKHCVGMCCLFKMPEGYCDEDGLEGMHVICNNCRIKSVFESDRDTQS